MLTNQNKSAIITKSKILGHRQAVRQRTLTPSLPRFESWCRSQKNSILLSRWSFSVIFACGEFYAQVRDMSFGRGMRFARWKLQGEYNITVSVANNITFSKQKYHAERERSISLNLFTTHNFCDTLYLR